MKKKTPVQCANGLLRICDDSASEGHGFHCAPTRLLALKCRQNRDQSNKRRGLSAVPESQRINENEGGLRTEEFESARARWRQSQGTGNEPLNFEQRASDETKASIPNFFNFYMRILWGIRISTWPQDGLVVKVTDSWQASQEFETSTQARLKAGANWAWIQELQTLVLFLTQ
ncbi:hypothetical protein TNCV_4418711 [Trichonephila clavipes]|nr:hypothetical protein TNCV_4418711 [Trichonephila clavipes]